MTLKITITFAAFLLAISAVGLLFLPSQMLSVVGIVSNAQLDFVLRASGVGVGSFIPGVWAARTAATSSVSRAVLMGLVGYTFLSSLVDFHAYTQSIVNTTALPSIAFRTLLGVVILLLVRRETAQQVNR